MRPFCGAAGRFEDLGMKVSNEYVLRQVADEYLLIPVGEAALRISGMISLTESGCLLYRKLSDGCDREALVQALLTEYEVEEAEARQDVEAFLEKLRKLQMLEEES